MLRIALLSLILLVSLSSTTLLRKSISRRQSEPEPCYAIEGFDCKCSPYRISCTSDRDLPQTIKVLPNEKQKYPSVELIISGERDQNVNEHTFEPVKQLYKSDAENLEFRLKFEKFTALHLSTPGVFNRVFPDNVPSTTQKHLSLEIYNPLVQPNDNVNLFANLNVDSLELYVLYPFRGTFQQLFTGANIKYLRLSGGDIRSDLSQPFTGNIGRLELAKQAGQLTAQNFPIYPAHELIINAFYVTNFTSDNPPNYSNLGELRIHSQERVPANAFRHYSNLHTLSVATEKDIDPHAFDGLHNLEKLTIKDTKPSLEFLNSLPNLKEFESNVEKLDEREQCQLIEKLANGQVVIQAIASGRECTCASAYLDSASGRYPCDAQQCDQSTCAAIKNNYDATTRTFKAAPPIKRLDGSDATRQRPPKVYTGPFQITQQDQDKLQHTPSQQTNEQQEGDGQQHSGGVTPAGQTKKSRRPRPRNQTLAPTFDQQQNPGDQSGHPYHPESQPSWNDSYSNNLPGKVNDYYSSVTQNGSPQTYLTHTYEEHERIEVPWDYPNDYESNTTAILILTDSNQGEGGEQTPLDQGNENEQGGEGNDNRQGGEGQENRGEGEGNENQPGGEDAANRQEGNTGHERHTASDPNQSQQAVVTDNLDGVTAPPPKKGWGWFPIIIVIAIVAGLILTALIILLIRRQRRGPGYNAAATSDQGTAATTRA